MTHLHDQGFLILTDGEGRPFERLTAPGADAPIDEKIAFLRSFAARNDAITAAGGRAFDRRFRKAVR